MDVIPLPPRPSLEQYRKRAKDLVKAWKSSDPDALKSWASDWLQAIIRLRGEEVSDFVLNSMERATDRFTEYLRWKKDDQGSATIADAQFVIARAHGFQSWSAFVAHIDAINTRSTETNLFERAADAVVSGDIDTLRELLREHPELVREHSTRSHAATLLHYVAANGVEDFRQKSPKNSTEIARLLLDSGAQVDAIADTYGKDKYQTTLNLLVSSTHPAEAGVQVPIVELLLDRGAAINGLDDDCSPLVTALAFGYRGAADALVRRGARVDSLITAAALGRLDVVQKMVIDKSTLAPERSRAKVSWVQQPAEPTAAIEQAAVWAAMYGRSDVVNWLLDLGVNPKAQDGNRMTLLHWLAGRGDLDIVKRLIAAGADLEAQNTWGGTVLDAMVWSARHDPWPGTDYVARTRYLIEQGADPKMVSPLPTGIVEIDRLLQP